MTDSEDIIPVGWNPIPISVQLVAGQDWTINIETDEELVEGTTVVCNVYPPGTQKLSPSEWPDPVAWPATVETNSVSWHVESAQTDAILAKSYVRWMISYPIDESGDFDDYCWAKGLVVRDD